MPENNPAAYLQQAAQALALAGAEYEKQGADEEVLTAIKSAMAKIRDAVAVQMLDGSQQQPHQLSAQKRQTLADAMRDLPVPR